MRQELNLVGNDFSNLVTFTFVAQAAWELPTSNSAFPPLSLSNKPITTNLSLLPPTLPRRQIPRHQCHPLGRRHRLRRSHPLVRHAPRNAHLPRHL